MLRPSLNHGTLRLPDGDDDDVGSNSIKLKLSTLIEDVKS